MPEGIDAYRDFMRDFNSHAGLIETILSEAGRLPHWNGHCHRLKTSFETLGWPLREEWPEQIYREILALLAANLLTGGRAKLRLLVFEASGQIHYMSESFDFPFEKKTASLNIGLARDITVAAGRYAFMKNNQRTVYEAAAQQALENGFQDVLLLNAAGKVAESTVANVFVLRDNQLLTPLLADGCVQGVFRRELLSGVICFQGLRVAEQSLTPEDIKNADAVFLGNALRGMRQVDNLFF